MQKTFRLIAFTLAIFSGLLICSALLLEVGTPHLTLVKKLLNEEGLLEIPYDAHPNDQEGYRHTLSAGVTMLLTYVRMVGQANVVFFVAALMGLLAYILERNAKQ